MNDLLFNSLKEYFTILESTGYFKYSSVNSLLGLILADSYISTDLSIFITEEDLKTITSFIECITDKECIVPYKINKETIAHIGDVLPKLDYDTYRYSEDNNIRKTESNEIRITE